ncbi:MAG: hypothetical protein QM736_29750 [Vicinamibacterales bacterium]
MTNEFDVEFEQQLRGSLVLSTGYFYRSYRDQIGARNLAVPTAGYTPITVTEKASGETVTVFNQDPATRGRFDTVYSNEPALDRTFHGVDLDLQKRMSNGWMLMGSVSYGKNVGDIYGATADLNNPNYTFRRGVATVDDVPLFLKISGAYDLPWGIQTAGNWSHYRGWPETTTVRVGSDTVRLTQVTQNIVIEPRGEHRMENVSQLDLELQEGDAHRHLQDRTARRHLQPAERERGHQSHSAERTDLPQRDRASRIADGQGRLQPEFLIALRSESVRGKRRS